MLITETIPSAFAQGTEFVFFSDVPKINFGRKTLTIAGSKVMLAIKLMLTAKTTMVPKLFSGTTLLEINTPNPQEIARKLKNNALPVLG